MGSVRLMTLDPGHFHAALVQKEMYANVDKQVHVYAPLGADLTSHVERIVGFNNRAEKPTSWELEVHASPDFAQRAWQERPGNVVILSGRNRPKIGYIRQAVAAGLNVLADKPWIIRSDDLPVLEESLNEAEKKGLVIYDIMTERFEITNILQRELIHDAAVFGESIAGTFEEPAVYMESKHFLLKTVAGVPLRRPVWFFDIGLQGEGLTDVGTHLVDLVPWLLFPDQAIDYRREVEVLQGRRWPTLISRADFHRISGADHFPDFLANSVRDDLLEYFCNNSVAYTVRSVHVKMDILWDFEAAPGSGDTHFAVVRGSRSRIEIRQGPEQGFRPELYVVPNRQDDQQKVFEALEKKIVALSATYPGLAIAASNNAFQVLIPDRYRIGHEAHFAEVTRKFLTYLEKPASLPAWEKANMLAKYFVTTKGVDLAHQPNAR
ncbi:MAG: oxidoreductase [Gemmatales bacterium]|nr:MAG: oxidoreductase [Gemmatales bacterium]